MIANLRFLIRDAWTVFGWRLPLLIGVMIAGGLFEGLAIAIAVPLLSGTVTGGGGAGSGSGIVGFLAQLPGWLGLPDGTVGVGIVMAFFLLMGGAMFLLQARLSAGMQNNYSLYWQVRLFERAMAAGPLFLDDTKSSDVVAALTVDAARVGGVFYHASLMSAALLNFMIYFAIAMLFSVAVSSAILAYGAVLFLLTRPFVLRAYRIGRGITQAQADVQQCAGEFVSAVKTVKIFGAEKHATDLLRDAAGRLAHGNFRNGVDIQTAKAVFEFGGAMGIATLLILAPIFLDIEVEIVIVILALFVRLLPRITALQQGLQALSALLPALENMRRMVADAQAHAEPRSEQEATLPAGVTQAPEIRFEGVGVAFDGRPVLDGVDLTLPAGGSLALVGPSGAGKSTLVDTVLGFRPVQTGRIFVDGHDLADLPLAAWRRAVGYVPQDIAVFSESFADNLRLGQTYPDVEMQVALERAAAAYAMKLPEGLATKIGAAGVKLSGGERQRLGMARVLMAPRRLYVLDEATSALDAETEAEVVRTLAELRGKATVLVIAHRFSAIRSVDRIAVLDRGKVVEIGEWQSLDREGTLFHRLKSLQEVAGGQ